MGAPPMTRQMTTQGAARACPSRAVATRLLLLWTGAGHYHRKLRALQPMGPIQHTGWDLKTVSGAQNVMRDSNGAPAGFLRRRGYEPVVTRCPLYSSSSLANRSHISARLGSPSLTQRQAAHSLRPWYGLQPQKAFHSAQP